MDVFPVLMGPNNTRLLVEELRGSETTWTIASHDAGRHPNVVLRREGNRGNVPLLMERADGEALDADRARLEAADMIEMLLDVSLRPKRPGIGARLLLAAVKAMADREGRRIDVHARGPWLPLRIHQRDDGPPPFGPRTLDAWNLACAPGLRVSSRIGGMSGTFVGSPRILDHSPEEPVAHDPLAIMRTIGELTDLIEN